MEESPTENNDKIVNSAGEKSVSIGGNVSQSTINTGDNYNFYVQENQPSPLIRNILESKIENLSTELSQKVAANLEDLREKFREGNSGEAFEGIRLLRNSTNWDAFEPELRAAILRALASMTLAMKGDDAVAEARKLADEARQNNETQNDDVLRARIKTFEEGFEAAIEDFAKINTTESYNLRLNCLLNTGKMEEVLKARENPPAGISLNAETHRFYALALLASKNTAEAETEIKKAQAEKPNWQYVRFSAAIIDYYSAVSPTILPPHLVSYPRPFPFAWAKIDDESQRKLSDAAEEFSGLVKQFKAESQEERECNTWHFACVANLLGRQREAIEIGKSLLEKNPADLQILSWFLFRGYEFDYEISLKALEQKETGDDVSIEDLLGLIGIFLRQGSWKNALKVIDRRREVFASVNEINLWRYWRGTALLQGEKIDEALTEESEITDGELNRLLKTNILYYKGDKLGDWKPFNDFLRERYKKDSDSDAFLSLYEIKAQQDKDEKFLVDNAESYCEKAQTASAVDFVVSTLWRLGRAQKCLELLEKYEPLFPHSKLPGHLRRLKIHCLIKTDIKKALEEAETLAKDDRSVENIALLMDVHLVKGDLTGLQVASRKLLQRDDVEAQDLLRAAHVVQVKDANLAAKFWTRAVGIGVPDDPELVAFAQSIASKLGLENESEELMKRMMRQAHEGRGPMKIMSLRQLFKQREKWARAEQEIDQKYGTGEMPLQLLTKQKKISLAKIFSWIADKNKSNRDLHHSPRLLIRHGSRIVYPLENFVNAKNWHLHLDITSLLLAHKLGILEKLEKLFRPLKISRHTVTALIEQRDGLRPHQKSQLENSQTVADLYDKKKINTPDQEPLDEVLDKIRYVVAEFQNDNKQNRTGKKQRRIKKKRLVVADAANLETQLGDRRDELARAINEDGFAVGFLPLNCYGKLDHSVLRLPESLENRIVNCRAIVDSLRAYNRISEDKYKQVVHSLGSERNPVSKGSPLPDAKLFLMSGVADSLARANVLQAVCENFDVVISESSLAEARNTIQYYKEMEELGDSLDELIARVNDGLDEGIYEFIRVPDNKRKREDFSDGSFGQDIKSTLDLLLFDPQEWDVICVDDRALTKHAFRQENGIFVPMLGINELLSALRQNGELDEQEYYDLFLHLRRSNFRYFPISEDEIIYRLNQAAIRNGRIVETEALSILRQYHASCLLDEELLQITDNQFSETPFITQGTESVNNAIVQVWKDELSNDEIVTARADWIFDNLYTGNLGCTHLRNKTIIATDKLDEVNLLAFDVCNLLMRGLILEDRFVSLKDEPKSRRFFEWLSERMLTTRCVSSPEVFQAIAREVEKRFKVAQARDFRTAEEKLYAGIFMGRFFISLPEGIAKEISFDQEMFDWLKVRVGNTVMVADVNFDADEYWRVIERTIAGEKASLKATDSEKECFFLLEQTVEIRDADRLFPTIQITDIDGNQLGVVQDPSFGILAPDIETRLAVINELRSWFDYDQEEFERTANEIAVIEDSIERVSRFYKVRESSMVFFYSNLEERFRSRDVITWQELMPPSSASLAGYFRLPTSTDGKNFREIWSKAAGSLLDEEELIIAISRVSSLPVKMPAKVIERFLILPNDEKADLLRNLSPVWSSPIQLLHLVNLAAQSLLSESEEISEIAKELLGRLYEANDEKDVFVAFRATLSFVNDEFHFWSERTKLSPEIALAVIWGHATRLYNIQRAVGMEPKNIVAGFGNRRESYFLESLTRKPEFWNDCVYPRRTARTDFLTHAAANLFAGINNEVLEALMIPELIKKEVFRESDNDEVQIPATKLLSDPTLRDDKLQSLLGGDRFETLSPIIGAENIEILKSENLKQSVKTYLEGMLENPKDTKNWIMIYAVANDLPIYKDLQELCLDVLKTSTADSLFQEGIENPAFVLFAAACQAANFGDRNLTANFQEKVLETFRKLESEDNFRENVEVRATLMDAALALSYVSNDALKSNEKFAAMVEKIQNEWKDFTNDFGHAFNHTFWNIPVVDGDGWRHLNLIIRFLQRLGEN
jgi:hypothetical protein